MALGLNKLERSIDKIFRDAATLSKTIFSMTTPSITIKNESLSILAHDTIKLRVIYAECYR
jgi:hypothetical protein